MAYSFNIFTGTFDEVLPISPQTFGSTPNSDGVSADGANNLTLQPADGTHPGGVSTTTQSFGGNKTFIGSVAVNGSVTLSALQASTALTSDSSKNIISSVTTSTELSYVSGVTSAIQTQLNLTEKLANKGVANGYCPLDASTKIPATYLPSTVFEFQGAWDPSTNTPTLTDLTGTAGYVYRVSTLFAGPIIGLSDPSMVNFQIGNLVIYSGTAWQQNTAADGVTSVNGAQGAVTVNAINQLTGDIIAGPASQSQSKVASIAAIQGTTVTGTTGTGDVVFNIAPTITGAATFTGNTVFNNNISAPGIFNPFGPAIDLTTGSVTDSSGVHKFDWVNGNLTDTSNNTQLHWDTSGVEFNQLTASTVPYLNSSKVLTSSAVTPTQLSFVDATSSIQTQLNSKANSVPTDIVPTSFSASNNISSAANVTGLNFPTASIGSFEALVQVSVVATTNLRQAFKIQGNLTGASGWDIIQTTSGDNSGFIFTITSGGQIQYSNLSYPGFVSATIKFRAATLTP